MKGKKPGLKSTIWNRGKKQTFNWNIKKNEEFSKNEERLRKLQDNFKCSNIKVIGVPEGEEEGQEMENLFEKIIKENIQGTNTEGKEIGTQINNLEQRE